jgi:dienelactone hydrolase
MTADKRTGKGRRCLYKSGNPRCQLELVESHGVVFVRESNCLQKRIGYLTEAAVHWMTPRKPTTMSPLSKTAWVENRHIVGDGRRTPLPHGEFLEDAALFTETEALVVTVKNACCSLYRFDFPHRSFTPLLIGKTPNQIRLSRSTPVVFLSYPDRPTEVWDVRDVRRVLTFPCPLRLPLSQRGFVASSDGTQIPYTIVSHSPKPTKLIVEAYGAYGISGHRAYPVSWLAQLERGYALAVVFARGGRENGDDWWLSGSAATRKEATFEDVYAAIPAIQRRLGIPVERTMVYGRSAGGWVAARVAQHSPPLCAAVFAEVPYVDVLRTTSNPRLPLTQMEYDEFGDPRRPADYAALLRLSPVDTVPLAFPGAPVVLARTGLHDMEVSPYEAVKWVTKLQGLGWKAFLGVDEHGGHFAAKQQQEIQAAENAAFFDDVLRHTGGRGTRKSSVPSKRSTFNSTRRRKH